MANAGAWSQGWAIGAGAAQHQRDRKEWLSDQDHAIKRDEYLKDLDSYRDQIKTLKDNPQYADQVKKLTDLAAQREYDLHQLYDPVKAPGRLQQDWHYLRERIHGIKQPQSPVATATPQVSQTPQDGVAPTTLPGMQGVSGTPTPEQVALGGASASPVAIPEMPAYKQASQGTPVPKGATPTMAVAKPKGLVEPGNIPIWNRPSVHNDDGTHSSELSISMQDDKGNEVLIPLIVDGRFLTPDGKMPPGPIPQNAQEWDKASPEWKALKMKAWQHYENTGQHLGKFGGPTAQDDVDAYAQILHNRDSLTARTTGLKPAPAPSWGKAQLLKKQALSRQKAQEQAALLAAGAGLSPEQEAVQKARSSVAAQQVIVDSKMKMFDQLFPNASQEDKDRYKNLVAESITGAKTAATAGKWDRSTGQINGKPVSLIFNEKTGEYRYPTGESVPSDLLAGFVPDPKASGSMVGSILNTKKYGWIKTWVSKTDPSKVTGFQKITPGRQYTGTTSNSSSTDAFGLTTSSSRSTMPTGSTPVDIDLSGMQELPAEFNGEDTPAPASAPSGSPNKGASPSSAPPSSVSKPATTPKQLMGQVPSPPPQAATNAFPLDSTGHIPINAPYNKMLIGAANDLLDGKDKDKLDIPQKAKEAASNLARQYGWGGQGMFNPQQKLQIKEASTFLNEAINDPSLSVLDSLVSRKKLIANLNNSEGKAGFIQKEIAEDVNLNPKEAEFLRLYRQLTGTISGLTSLSRSGKPTEAGIKRLMSELPDPRESHSASDGKKRLQRLVREIEIAKQAGNADKLLDPSGSTQHKEGDTVMLNGQKVVIKKIYPDGTFDY